MSLLNIPFFPNSMADESFLDALFSNSTSQPKSKKPKITASKSALISQQQPHRPVTAPSKPNNFISAPSLPGYNQLLSTLKIPANASLDRTVPLDNFLSGKVKGKLANKARHVTSVQAIGAPPKVLPAGETHAIKFKGKITEKMKLSEPNRGPSSTQGEAALTLYRLHLEFVKSVSSSQPTEIVDFLGSEIRVTKSKNPDNLLKSHGVFLYDKVNVIGIFVVPGFAFDSVGDAPEQAERLFKAAGSLKWYPKDVCEFSGKWGNDWYAIS
jgi:hypothetical protein